MPRTLLALSLMNVLVLMACARGKDEADGGDSAVDTEPVVIDDDGDGVRAEDDCDDNDAATYPGAAEPCDGRDNDCDGSVDEGAQAVFYADGDGDGYGHDDAEVMACEAPEGHVERGGDCDDNNRDAFPGAEEVCDGADNNCDGATDEGLTTTYYADNDGDGDGDPAAPIIGCELPPGAALTAGDCDDNNPTLSSLDADDDGLASCDGDCDDNNENRVAYCEYTSMFGNPAFSAQNCVYGMIGEATDPSTRCPSCDFGFMSRGVLIVGDCASRFTALLAYDIEGASLRFMITSLDHTSIDYTEFGPFSATLTYGASYDTLSFSGESDLLSEYEGRLNLYP